MKVLRAYPAARADLKPSEKSRDAKDLAWTFVFEGFGASQAAGWRVLNPQSVRSSGQCPHGSLR
jgi:hypothetical protein